MVNTNSFFIVYNTFGGSIMKLKNRMQKKRDARKQRRLEEAFQKKLQLRKFANTDRKNLTGQEWEFDTLFPLAVADDLMGFAFYDSTRGIYLKDNKIYMFDDDNTYYHIDMNDVTHLVETPDVPFGENEIDSETEIVIRFTRPYEQEDITGVEYTSVIFTKCDWATAVEAFRENAAMKAYILNGML